MGTTNEHSMHERQSQITACYRSQFLTDEKVEELEKLKGYYHKLYTCYKWKYKKLRKIKLALNMSSILLIVTGTIVGSVTLNPIVLGTISGSGVLITGYMLNSGLSNKVDNCKFAYTNYQKIIIQLKTYLRGMPYDTEVFLSDAKVIEELVVDMCPPINGMEKRYDKIYGKL